MRYLISDIKDKNNVFVGAVEPYTAMKESLKRNDIKLFIALCVLLYDHVIISGAHFWLTPVLSEIIPSLELYITNGDIIPVIRNRTVTANMAEYYEIRKEEILIASGLFTHNVKAFQVEVSDGSMSKYAKEIDGLGTLAYIDNGSIEMEFRRLWTEELLPNIEPLSIYNLSQEYFENDSGYYEIFIKSLAGLTQYQYFSRGIIAQYVNELIVVEKLKYILIQRATELYLQASANICCAELASTCISYNYIVSGQDTYGPLNRSNIHLFMLFLNKIGISSDDIVRMNSEDIIKIKSTPEYLLVREMYYELMNKAENAKNNIKNELFYEMNKMILKEKGSRYLMKGLKYIEAYSGIIFGAAFSVFLTMNNQDIYNLVRATGVTYGASMFLNKLKILQQTPVLDFKEFVNKTNFIKHLKGAC